MDSAGCIYILIHIYLIIIKEKEVMNLKGNGVGKGLERGEEEIILI